MCKPKKILDYINKNFALCEEAWEVLTNGEVESQSSERIYDQYEMNIYTTKNRDMPRNVITMPTLFIQGWECLE